MAYYDLGEDAVDYQGLEGPTWEGTWSVVAATSSDRGESFAAGVVVDDAVVPPERVLLVFTMPPPALAADAEDNVYAAFADATSGDWDVWMRASPDGGRTWQPRRRLNDDPVGNGRHQYLPRLSVAASGRLDAAFYDRRHDVENVRNDVYYTSSSDGGASVSANVRVTTQGFRSDIGPTYPIPSAAGLVDFGSRLGLVSHGERAFVTWTDTRNSLPGEQQDIFATEVGSLGSAGPEVPLTRVGGRSRWFLRVGLAGAAVVAAAVVVVVLVRRRPASAGGEGPGEPARQEREPEGPSDGAITDGRAGTGDDP